MSKGAIILTICGFFSGGIFLAIGIRAFLAKKPVNFWAGTKIPPESVPDIPGYNRANGKMWLIFSIPWLLAGVCGLLSDLHSVWLYLCLIFMIIASSVGMYWLLNKYQKIYSEFVS